MLWRAGPTRGAGTRRGSALPPMEPPPLSIIPPAALGCSTPQSLPLSASPEMANPQRFLGSSLVAWHGLSLPISQPWHLSLMFRTRQANGVLLQAVTRGRSTITLQVMRGRVGGRWALTRAAVASKGAGQRGLGGVFSLPKEEAARAARWITAAIYWPRGKSYLFLCGLRWALGWVWWSGQEEDSGLEEPMKAGC